MNYGKRSLDLHKQLAGKLKINSKLTVRSRQMLSLLYTPGVGAVSSHLAAHPEDTRLYTGTGNTVAVISDGSAVLGLGNLGPYGALPVMEGKAILFQQFGGLNAVPIVLSTQDPDEIIKTVMAIAPSFGGINLEDISAPHCFYIEETLKEQLQIPIMHDDQHGTAIVVTAGVMNALKVVRKNGNQCRAVVIGAGAAGYATAMLLKRAFPTIDITAVDSKGAIHSQRHDLDAYKQKLAMLNTSQRSGSLEDVIRGADLVIGVSKPELITPSMIAAMAPSPIIFALANPIPEIMPDAAKKAGAAVIATGRSDFPNQVNNLLAFPGVFQGAMLHGVSRITDEHKLAAAQALAALVAKPGKNKIIPSVFDRRAAAAIAAVIR